MKVFIVLISLVYSFLVALLIYTRKENKCKLGLVFKTFLGLIFVFVSLAILFFQNIPLSIKNVFIVLALITSSLGDVFLGICKIDKINENYYFYLAGVIITISQILFIISSIILFDFYPISIIVVGFSIFCFHFTCNKYITKNKKALHFIFYLILGSLAAINSLNGLLNEPSKSVSLILFTYGIVLYAISDFVLYFTKFSRKNWFIDTANKILYYGAEFLIACSLLN